MKTSLMCVGVGASLLFSVMGCQKEGVATGGSGGAQMGGSLGSGGSAMGGSPGAGGAHMDGSPGDDGHAAGGSSGNGGLAATGGSSALGGMTSAGGTFGAGGLPSSGGIGAAGGRVGTGGSVDGGGIDGGGVGGGGITGTGGKVGSGGSLGTGGVIGTGGALGGTGGTTAKMCGGIAVIKCPAAQFCELPVGDCGKTPDIAGTCTSTGSGICSAIIAPVCGCDGKTYNNNCLRLAAGVSEASSGACVTPACPTDLSQIATWTCTEGLTCEYGTDPRPECRPSATCTNGAWTTSQPTCAQLPAVTCPTTREAAAGQTCPTSGAYCVYGDLSCLCTSCSTTGPVICTTLPTWHCASPNTTAGCPAGIPRLGSACTTDGLSCTYSCGAGGARLCKKSAWYTADGGICLL